MERRTFLKTSFAALIGLPFLGLATALRGRPTQLTPANLARIEEYRADLKPFPIAQPEDLEATVSGLEKSAAFYSYHFLDSPICEKCQEPKTQMLSVLEEGSAKRSSMKWRCHCDRLNWPNYGAKEIERNPKSAIMRADFAQCVGERQAIRLALSLRLETIPTAEIYPLLTNPPAIRRVRRQRQRLGLNFD